MMRGGPIKVDSLEELQEIAQRFIKAHEHNDIETQHEILRQLIENEQEAYQRKLRLLAELKTLMQEARAVKGTPEHIPRLVSALRFCCDLRAIGYEELADQETGDKAQEATFKLYDQLNATGPEGHAALVKLLDDPSRDVRSSVAVLLLRELPERAIPVIEEIERTAPASDASISAGFALSSYRWELERETQATPPPPA
jgi:HEAT repeat protein